MYYKQIYGPIIVKDRKAWYNLKGVVLQIAASLIQYRQEQKGLKPPAFKAATIWSQSPKPCLPFPSAAPAITAHTSSHNILHQFIEN